MRRWGAKRDSDSEAIDECLTAMTCVFVILATWLSIELIDRYQLLDERETAHYLCSSITFYSGARSGALPSSLDWAGE